MSKNISIQEGGIGKQLTVDKLKTNLVGGGSCLWVPEDGITLGTKHISENGTFRASADGYYGYSEVTVSGVGSVTGRDPDTGEEKQVTVDPQTGDIVETILPVEIRITTLPTKLAYVDGESIDITGIVVKAYKATGGVFGTVPNNELSINPTVASSGGSETGGSGSATSDLQGNLAQPIAFLPAGSIIHCIRNEWGDNVKARFDCDTVWCLNNGHYIIYGMADSSSKLSSYDYKAWRTSWGQVEPAEWTQTTFIQGSNQYTANDKTVYYGSHAGWYNIVSWVVQPPTISTSDYPNGADAWTVVYGERSVDPGGNQSITVSWPRSDGKVLDTSYDINVT